MSKAGNPEKASSHSGFLSYEPQPSSVMDRLYSLSLSKSGSLPNNKHHLVPRTGNPDKDYSQSASKHNTNDHVVSRSGKLDLASSQSESMSYNKDHVVFRAGNPDIFLAVWFLVL